MLIGGEPMLTGRWGQSATLRKLRFSANNGEFDKFSKKFTFVSSWIMERRDVVAY